MSQKEIFWCGEGDLVLQPSLKTRNLFISRPARSDRNAKNAGRGHNLGTRLPGPKERGTTRIA
jgi:hypothetical protein